MKGKDTFFLTLTSGSFFSPWYFLSPPPWYFLSPSLVLFSLSPVLSLSLSPVLSLSLRYFLSYFLLMSFSLSSLPGRENSLHDIFPSLVFQFSWRLFLLSYIPLSVLLWTGSILIHSFQWKESVNIESPPPDQALTCSSFPPLPFSLSFIHLVLFWKWKYRQSLIHIYIFLVTWQKIIACEIIMESKNERPNAM